MFLDHVNMSRYQFFMYCGTHHDHDKQSVSRLRISAPMTGTKITGKAAKDLIPESPQGANPCNLHGMRINVVDDRGESETLCFINS